MGSVIRHSLYCIAGVFIVACIAKRIPGLILANDGGIKYCLRSEKYGRNGL